MASALTWGVGAISMPEVPAPTQALSPTEPPAPTLDGAAVQLGGVWIVPLTLAFCKLRSALFVERVATSPWSLRLAAFHIPPGNRVVLVDWKLSVETFQPLKVTVVEATMAPSGTTDVIGVAWTMTVRARAAVEMGPRTNPEEIMTGCCESDAATPA